MLEGLVTYRTSLQAALEALDASVCTVVIMVAV